MRILIWPLNVPTRSWPVSGPVWILRSSKKKRLGSCAPSVRTAAEASPGCHGGVGLSAARHEPAELLRTSPASTQEDGGRRSDGRTGASGASGADAPGHTQALPPAQG